MTTVASGGASAGIAVLVGIEVLAARERQAQPQVRGLDVAMNEPRAVQRREPRARLEHHLPQLEERHAAAPPSTA